MHAPFDSTNSIFLFQTNYTNMSKVLCLTSAVSTNILVTSLTALKTERDKWPCNPIPHRVLSARHCHRQQSQTPTGTEINSCLACLALFIASWLRKLNGCFWEGVHHFRKRLDANILNQTYIPREDMLCLPSAPLHAPIHTHPTIHHHPHTPLPSSPTLTHRCTT